MQKNDFYLKKSVHFNLSKNAHAAFRIQCFKRSLSMQEVVEEFVQRVLAENPHIIKLLDEVPCGDKFPSCKFIKDAYDSKNEIGELKVSIKDLSISKNDVEAEV